MNKTIEEELDYLRRKTVSFARIIQRLECEGAELTCGDVREVENFKIYLGISTSVTDKYGTGSMISEYIYLR